MEDKDFEIDNDSREMKVVGALIQGYAQACLNLNVIAGTKIIEFTENINVGEWYPLEHWVALEKSVIQSYKNAKAILVRVGIEMMLAWYKFGPGQQLIKKGVDFLHYQTGSGGYVSVVQGPEEKVGLFELVSLNKEEGTAVIHSTTPFNRKMECGVIIGGMLAPGDLDYVDAVNYDEPDYIKIEFH